MSYASKFLRARGQPCVVERAEPVSTYLSMDRAGRTRGLGDPYWEGIVPASVGLASGEIIVLGPDRFLVQSAGVDAASGETAFSAVKTNAFLSHHRQVPSVDADGNIVVVWQQIAANVPAAGEVVTAALRRADPGLLDSTRVVFRLAKSHGIAVLDRLIHEGKAYCADSIDHLAMPGVVRVQCGEDLRP